MKSLYLALPIVLLFLSCTSKIPPLLDQVREINYSSGWEKVNSYPINEGRSDDLHFFDEKTGFVINSEGYLSFTEDGGETWEVVLENEGTFFRCITFKNRQEGWLGTIGADDPFLSSRDTIPMYETKDGGLSWESVEFIGPSPKGLCGLQKVNDNVIVGCGRVRGPSFFIKTIDGGENWYSQNMDDIAGSLIAAHFFDKDHGFLIGGTTRDKENSKSMVLETNDGGASWDTIYISEQIGEYPWKFAFPTRERGYISIQRNERDGSFYHLQTKDGGKTWEEVVHSEDYYYVQGIGFANAKIGYMGGSTGKTYQTRDGGETWIPFANIGNGFNNFQFFESGKAYGVGFGVFKCDNVNNDGDVVTSYFDSGAMKSSYQILKNKRHGKASTFYKNGRVKSEGKYRDNLKKGNWKYYNENGKLVDKVKIVAGTAKINPASLNAMEGTYKDDRGLSRRVFVMDGVLYSQREGRDSLVLIPESSNQFYFAFNSNIKMKFLLDQNSNFSKAILIRSWGETELKKSN